MTEKERLDTTIDSIIQQIELLSSKSLLEANRKTLDDGYLVELSSVMLQLTRSLNELLLTKKLCEQDTPINHQNAIDFLITGRSK